MVLTAVPAIAWFNTYERRSPVIWISGFLAFGVHVALQAGLWVHFDGAVTISTVQQTVQDPLNLGSSRVWLWLWLWLRLWLWLWLWLCVVTEV